MLCWSSVCILMQSVCRKELEWIGNIHDSYAIQRWACPSAVSQCRRSRVSVFHRRLPCHDHLQVTEGDLEAQQDSGSTESGAAAGSNSRKRNHDGGDSGMRS